jgi:hypothetical protein
MLGKADEAASLAGKTAFVDVPETSWCTGYVNYAVANKIINGDGDGNFRPDDPVKYEEVIKVVVCVLGLDEDVKIEYTFEIRNEWNTNTYPYCFTSTVYFLTDDAAKIADGRKYDFASEFRLNIHNYGISISKGSVSEYTRNDKFQVARDLLLGKLWGVESQLTEIFMSLFDIDLYKRYNDIRFEIQEKEHNIKRVEKELEREKAIKMLKSNK